MKERLVKVFQVQLATGVIVAVKQPYGFAEYDDGLSAATLREINCLQLMRGCDHILQLLNLRLTLDTVGSSMLVDIMVTNHTSDLGVMIQAVTFDSRIQYADTVIQQLLDGMAHMYDRGILHRDVKPANILVDYHFVPSTGHDDGTGTIRQAPRCFYADFGGARQVACNPRTKD